MNSENGVFKALFEKLEKFLRTETVVGDALQVGNITLIPVISVSFGVGAGQGSGKDHKGNDGEGYGGGVGCKIAPNAMLVIKNDEVSVVPLTSRGSLEKIVEMVPEIIGKMDGFKTEGKSKKSDQ
ncbi:MAG: sporulation protein [Firmicutes bacterium]|nr:sporulation protein [Bacillota bacterium]